MLKRENLTFSADRSLPCRLEREKQKVPHALLLRRGDEGPGLFFHTGHEVTCKS